MIGKLVGKDSENKNNQNLQNKRLYQMSLLTLGETEPLTINVEYPSVLTVEDAAKYSFAMFNKQHSLNLKWKVNLFHVYIAKKNGQPKQDLPSLDGEQLLYETGSQLFVMVVALTMKELLDMTDESNILKLNNDSLANRSTKEEQLENSPIKQRPSYTNSLVNNKKKKDDKQDNNNCFCFSFL